jgi:lipopolysaccharide transport system ATP-binding protein
MIATKEEQVATAHQSSGILINVRQVSKKYHLWESPRARLVYGLWSQIPSWFPKGVRELAQRRKTQLGRDFYALKDVSLRLGSGEGIVILGRNGSGKSTLLQIICGTVQPSAGTVERSYRRVGALLELGSGFNPEFTGRENVYLNGAVLGLSHDEIASKFDQILDFSEIHKFIDQPVKTYSSGMMVRLAFAVQVLVEPDLLIVDEALAVGDIFFQQKCFAHILKLKERGCSFLIVSHDTHSVQQICDRGVVLVEGTKYFEGNCQDAVREYGLVGAKRQTAFSSASQYDSSRKFSDESNYFEEPETWVEAKEDSFQSNRPAKLTRWSCTDECGKFTDIFFPGQTIRLFAEFRCTTHVSEASAGFAVRDKTGQIIHGKQYYQMERGKKISLDPIFEIQYVFTFDCRLFPGEYTLEFGLVDIETRSTQLVDSRPEETLQVLCKTPSVGMFVVAGDATDTIRRRGHFGMVDIDVRSDFRSTKRTL